MRRADVIAILARHAPRPVAPDTLGDATRLFAGGLDLDSVALLEAVIAVEEASGLRLREEDLGGDALASVGAFADFVIGRLGGGA